MPERSEPQKFGSRTLSFGSRVFVVSDVVEVVVVEVVVGRSVGGGASDIIIPGPLVVGVVLVVVVVVVVVVLVVVVVVVAMESLVVLANVAFVSSVETLPSLVVGLLAAVNVAAVLVLARVWCRFCESASFSPSSANPRVIDGLGSTASTYNLKRDEKSNSCQFAFIRLW